MSSALRDGNPLLVGAVVVRDVDVRDGAIADRPLHALAVPIRRERQLRPRHAAQRSLLLVDVVGRRVRVEARVAEALEAPAVLLGQRGAPRRDVDEPHLNGHAGRRPPDGADDHAVGAELLPLIERQVVDRGRRGNGLVRVAWYQVELPLEVQVLPQHLPHGLRGGDGLGVARQRNEIGHGVLRRQPRCAVDRHHDLILLPRRRLGRILSAQRERGAGGDGGGGGQQSHMGHQR